MNSISKLILGISKLILGKQLNARGLKTIWRTEKYGSKIRSPPIYTYKFITAT